MAPDLQSKINRRFGRQYERRSLTRLASQNAKAARSACNTAQYNIMPSRKTGRRIRVRSQETLPDCIHRMISDHLRKPDRIKNKTLKRMEMDMPTKGHQSCQPQVL